MATNLFVYDRTGKRLGKLPWSTLTRGIVRNDAGALAATVPLSLVKAGLLDGERYLRVVEDGVEAPDWYILDDDGDDPANDGGAVRPVSIGGRGVLGIFDWAEVYPWDHVPGGNLLGLRPEHPFRESPGGIMAELIRRAQARGAIPHVTFTFTAGHDSAGRPWPHTWARVYEAGTSLRKVLEQFTTDAWADFEMRGFELRLYVPDTELAQDHPETILRLGKGVTEAPRKRTRSTVRSTILAVGNEGAIIEVSDPDAVAQYGRREGFEGRAGVTDIGTLTAVTQVSLGRQTAASESVTLAVDPKEAPPIPRPGGYLRYDQRRLSATQLEPMRVQSIAWEYGDSPRLSVELNDLWVDADIRNGRRIDAILNGSSANERVPQPPLGDEVPPSEPGGLAINSAAYEDPSNGQQYAQVTATWLEVLTDVDGTPVGELLGYTIEWQQPEVSPGGYTFDVGVVTLAHWSPVVPDTPVRARIRAFDRWRNPSTWSPWVEVMAGVDETPPGKPTTPQVSNYLGLLRSYWDGQLTGGRPADFAALEVHVSEIDGFTPDPRPTATGGTLAGTLYAGGPVFTDTPYGAQRFVRFVAVDTTGNRSDPSDQAAGASGAVVEADIFDGAVGTAKLADLAVKSAKIDLLAVNSAQVGTIEVGKLIAGTMTAEVIMGGRIATALTGQRVEINSLGIFRWDAAGNQTVAIDDNGALLTGRYRTAITGRRIEMGSGGTYGQIAFYSPSGDKQSLTSSTWTMPNGVTTEALALRAGDQALIQALADNSVSMWGWSSAVIMRDVFRVWSADSTLVNNQRVRFEVLPDKTTVRMAVGGARIEVGGGSTEIAPMITALDDRGVGLGLRVVSSPSTGQRWEVVNWDLSSYMPIWASTFAVQSDEATKKNIATASAGLLDQVRATPVREYERRGEAVARGEDGKPRRLTRAERKAIAPARRELGLVAQEAPAQLVAGGHDGAPLVIDLYQMSTMTWGAVSELADQVTTLAAEVAALAKGTGT